jgi:hypothetical protein
VHQKMSSAIVSAPDEKTGILKQSVSMASSNSSPPGGRLPNTPGRSIAEESEDLEAEIAARGQFGDTQFDCMDDTASWYCARWFTPFRFAATSERAKLSSYRFAFWLMVGPVPLFFGLAVYLKVRDFTNLAWVFIAATVVWMPLISFMQRIRFLRRYAMGNPCHCCCLDVVLHATCCCELTLAQEARHVDRQHNLIDTPRITCCRRFWTCQGCCDRGTTRKVLCCADCCCGEPDYNAV